VFSGREENRFWWHRLPSSAFVPPLYATLSDDEWALMEAWYQDTNARNLVGEAAIPALSMLQGLVMGNMCRNVVQLGIYAGYSLLLVGFMMRRMGTPHAMFAVDIDASCVAYCREWLQRAGLEEFVRIEQGDSADPKLPAMAREYFGGPINLVFLDSSHQYRHTLSELDLWTDALNPGGFMFLHDTSEFAATFDASGEGGVHRAFAEWLGRHDEFHALNICNSNASHGTPSQVYKDGCGLGIIQKPA
jgi:cephalosporin hydroxylase